MNTQKMNAPIVALLAGLCLVACTNDPVDPGDIKGETGPLLVRLSADGDAGGLDPGLEEIWVRLGAVEAEHESRGWVTMSSDRVDIELMARLGGNPIDIGSADVWTGGYDTVRFTIEDAWVVDNGVQEDLSVSTGVDPFTAVMVVPGTFFVDADTVTTVTVGWDLVADMTDEGDSWSLGSASSMSVDLQ